MLYKDFFEFSWFLCFNIMWPWPLTCCVLQPSARASLVNTCVVMVTALTLPSSVTDVTIVWMAATKARRPHVRVSTTSGHAEVTMAHRLRGHTHTHLQLSSTQSVYKYPCQLSFVMSDIISRSTMWQNIQVIPFAPLWPLWPFLMMHHGIRAIITFLDVIIKPFYARMCVQLLLFCCRTEYCVQMQMPARLAILPSCHLVSFVHVIYFWLVQSWVHNVCMYVLSDLCLCLVFNSRSSVSRRCCIDCKYWLN